MKVDVLTLRGCSGELPPMCAATIDEMKNAPTTEAFVEMLDRIRDWHSYLGKTEMARWVDVLDRCDEVLATAVKITNFRITADTDATARRHALTVLRFTALLFENTTTRSLYASMDRLLSLLDCSDMEVVSDVLHCLQIISKRSRFLPRLPMMQKAQLMNKLTAIAQCWGGRLRSVKMEECVLNTVTIPHLFPFQFTNNSAKTINIDCPAPERALLEVMHEIRQKLQLDDSDDATLLARLRMLRGFHDAEYRTHCLVARLIAISTIIYSRCQSDEQQLCALLMPSLIEESAAVLRIDQPANPLVDMVKAEVLRTLTSIVSLEKPSKLQQLIECLGVSSYHGFLAVMTRKCVEDLKSGQLGQPGRASVSLCTALFSLLYHMSGLDPGGDALVSCGLTQMLLSVVSAHSLPLEHISFVTRCVRVIDIITTLDAAGFNANHGMDVCVARLVFEVGECAKEQPFVLDVSKDVEGGEPGAFVTCAPPAQPCHQQRSALIKSLLNFIKRAIQDTQFSEPVRHMMEGALPDALIHIVSNADYYTAGLYHSAIQLATNFVYQEPAQLTQLQQKHLPYAILHSLLRKEIPNSRDVINNMANTFTALCLNERGLEQFKSYSPFDHVFKIVLSIKFIVAMKRKRNEMNDAAVVIGGAFDDLLRHQPTLRPLMLTSIVNVMTRLIELGNSTAPNAPKMVMSLSRTSRGSNGSAAVTPTQSATGAVVDGGNSSGANSAGASASVSAEEVAEEQADPSDDDDLEMEESQQEEESVPDRMEDVHMGLEMDCTNPDGTRVLPLGEYMLIFGKIVETLLTQNTPSDMVDGFVEKGGVDRLLELARVQHIRVELAASQLPQHIANVLKHLLQHSSNEQLLQRIMSQYVAALEPLSERADPQHEGVSLLATFTPAGLTDALTGVTNAVTVLNNLSKTATGTQADLCARVLSAWLEESGRVLLGRLHRCFRVLSWEKTLIAMVQASTKVTVQTQTEPQDMSVQADLAQAQQHPAATVTMDTGSARPAPAGTASCVASEAASPRKPLWQQVGLTHAEHSFWIKNKDIVAVLHRTHRHTAELLMMLSRICMGPSSRTRRHYTGDHPTTQSMTKLGGKLADAIFAQLNDDFAWPAAKARSNAQFGYLADEMNLLSMMLLDERKNPYHAMLARFYKSGCHKGYFEMCTEKLAPALKNPILGNCARTVACEWLRLAERLVVRQSLLQPRHRMLPEFGDGKDFPIDKYYKLMQIDMFSSLNVLFNQLSDDSVDLLCNIHLCEMSIGVYKEVVRNLVQLRNSTQSVPSAAAPATAQAAAAAPAVNDGQLDMLVEMGFDRQHCINALMQFGDPQAAMDYLVNHEEILDANESANMSEEGRRVVQRVLNSSAGGLGGGEVGEASGVGAAAAAAAAGEEMMEAREVAGSDAAVESTITPLRELKLDVDLDQAVSRTCLEIVPLCKRLMRMRPEMVYITADLVTSVVDSAEPEWRRNVLVDETMRKEVHDMCCQLMAAPSEEATKTMSTRLHFVCLLLEHVSVDYLSVIEAESPHDGLLSVLVRLLQFTLDNYEHEYLHKSLLSPLLLWMDLFEKTTRLHRRRKLLSSVSENLKWSYYGMEDRYMPKGKWVTHSTDTSATITKAFLAGKPSVVVKAGSRELTVNLVEMVQRTDGSHEKNIVCCEIADEGKQVDLQEVMRQESMEVFPAVSSLLTVCVGLLGKRQLHHNAAHSILVFIARLTRSEKHAEAFVHEGGVAALLQLRCASSPSTSTLLALIVRQCIDDDHLLQQLFEKAIRSVSHSGSTAASSAARWGHRSVPAARDWNSCLHMLAPLAARQPDTYRVVMNKVARLANGELHVHPSTGPAHNQPNKQAHQIVEQLLVETLKGEWKETATGTDKLMAPPGRLVSRAGILELLAELIKSYGCIAQMVTEQRVEGQSVLYRLMDRFIDGVEDKDACLSLKRLVSALAACNHAPKAQDSLVSDVKTALNSLSTPPSTGANEVDAEKAHAVHLKVSELSSLLLAMRDACPPPTTQRTQPGQPTPPAHNAILKLIYKKRICNDLVRTITHLQLCHKDAIATVNNVIKTLDELTRSMTSVGNPTAVVAAAVGGGVTEASASGEQAAQQMEVTVRTETHANDVAEARAHAHPDNAHAADDAAEEARNVMDHGMYQVEYDDEDEDDDDDDDDDDEDDDDDDEDDAERMERDDEQEQMEGEEEVMDETLAEDSMGSDGEEEEEAEREAAVDDTFEILNDVPWRRGEAEVHIHHHHPVEAEGAGEDDGEEERESDMDDETDAFNVDEVDDLWWDNVHIHDSDRLRNQLDSFDAQAQMLLDELDMLRPRGAGVAARADGLLGRIAGAGEDRLGMGAEQPAHQHPLMQRPRDFAGVGGAVPAAPLGVDALRNIAPVRLVMRTTQGRAPSGAVPLVRQNAVRRAQNNILGLNNLGDGFLDRIIDFGIGGNGGGILSRGRTGRPLFNLFDSVMMESPEERRRLQSVATGLERLTEAARMLDEQSLHHLTLLIHYTITQHAKAAEKVEKDKAAAEEAEKMIKKKKEEEERKEKEAKEKPAEETAAPAVAAAAAPEVSSALAAAIGPERVALIAAWDETERERERQGLPSQGEEMPEEAMDTTEPVGVVDGRHEDVSMDDAPLPSSSAATMASSAEGEEAMRMDGDQPVVEEASPDPPAEVAPPAPAADSGVQRVVVGDEEMEVPDGVDPEFLAALPEDMRAEVIRDHQRQQRAARAAQQPVLPVAAAAAAADASAPPAAAAASAVPTVEPLDQEFLAALPPELQEEVLANHERAVRAAEAAAAAAAAPPPPPAAEDPAAVIASLPTSLRQQVLADADDSVLQVLPQNLVDEARRLRAAAMEAHPMNRYRHLMNPRRVYTNNGAHRHGQHGAGWSGAPAVGGMAGSAATASSSAVPVVDREAIVTLIMLFLVQGNVALPKLQKVLKSVCTHAASCDFAVWCMMAMLDKASEKPLAEEEEETESGPSNWVDRMTVSGVGHNERVLRIAPNADKVWMHPLVSSTVCRNLLDTLHQIAKTYPGHFLPSSLRPEKKDKKEEKEGVEPPHYQLFWQMVQMQGRSSPKEKDSSSQQQVPYKFDSMETSPLSVLMRHLRSAVVAEHGFLQDKLLKTVSAVVQTLPDDTCSRVGVGVASAEECCEGAGPSGSRVRMPLEEDLRAVVATLTGGDCSPEGLTDGRTVLVEAIRALPLHIENMVHGELHKSIISLGTALRPQIEELLCQLGPASESSGHQMKRRKADSSARLEEQDEPVSVAVGDRRFAVSRYDGGRVVVDGDGTGRMDASACAELQLPAVRALTDKKGAQNALLAALQTTTKLRDTLRTMRKEQAKKRKEEREKKEKEAEQARKKEEEDKKEGEETPAEVPAAAESKEENKEKKVEDEEQVNNEPRLSAVLSGLDDLWYSVSRCLLRLGLASDAHAVLALQPAAEAFFLVHAVHSTKPASGEAPADATDDPDTKKIIEFAEKHREVLNQVLRQNPSSLSDGGPFAALTHLPKLLDFDVKRKYFRKQLTGMDENRSHSRREDTAVRVRRSHIFSDSFRELFRLRGNEWKSRFYIMFEGEEGQDAGGLLREWFSVITREIFNPNYALFITAPGDRVTYMINKASYINPEHLDYFKFVGRIIAKAIYDNKLLDCYFTRAFYKHMLQQSVRVQDMESEDPEFYKSLHFLLTNPIEDLGTELTFTQEVEEFGVRSVRPLKAEGDKIAVTDENKEEYVQLVCQMRMAGAIRRQLDAFLDGLYEVIPKRLLAMFNEQELELLISGLPELDIDDLHNNTEYRGYTKTSAQVQWFWRALRSFEQADRAKFLQFVTGTSKVPLQGFASLEGMNGVQKFSIHMDARTGDRLPTSHTCFNQLDLPQYDSYDQLRDALLLAIRECTEGFGFA